MWGRFVTRGLIATTALTVLACTSPTGSPSTPTARLPTSGAASLSGAPSTTATVTPGSALAAAEALPVKGRAPKTGYSRLQFGPSWPRLPGTSCDARNDVLRRDLTAVTIKPRTHGCVAATGTLHDPYTGNAIAFVRGVATSNAVEIDHVSSLGDAWQTGAQLWTPATRLSYANDPLVLLAVDGAANVQKGDADAASWLPPNKAFRCAFIARQVSIKRQYGLWVTTAEKAAMLRILASCPQQPLITGADAAVPPLAG